MSAEIELPEPDINTASHAHTRVVGYTANTVLRLIAEAVAAEREACEKACIEIHEDYGDAGQAAEAIRSRGAKT